MLHIGNKGHCRHQENIGNTALVSTDVVKDQGFLVTSNLNFEKHCAMAANKAMRSMSSVFSALSSKDCGLLLQAYKVFVRPTLEYGTPVLNPHSKETIQLLERVHKFITVSRGR